MTTYCGTTRLRNKKLHILWTGQAAEHLHDNFINPASAAIAILHIEAQTSLQKASNESFRGSVYFGLLEKSAFTVEVRWEKKGIFAKILTAHKFSTTANNLKKNKSIGKVSSQKITYDDLDDERKRMIEHEGLDADAYLRMLNRFVSSKQKKKKKAK